MSKTATVRARIEPQLKRRAERVFERLGINPTQAMTLFYKQVELRKGLPFDIVIPTQTTGRTFTDTGAGRDLVVCDDLEEEKVYTYSEARQKLSQLIDTARKK